MLPASQPGRSQAHWTAMNDPFSGTSPRKSTLPAECLDSWPERGAESREGRERIKGPCWVHTVGTSETAAFRLLPPAPGEPGLSRELARCLYQAALDGSGAGTQNQAPQAVAKRARLLRLLLGKKRNPFLCPSCPDSAWALAQPHAALTERPALGSPLVTGGGN